MNFKTMTVWSGGSKSAKNAKINAVLYFISFCLISLTIVLSFITNFNDDKTVQITLGEHLFFGFFMLFMVGWIGILMLFGFKNEIENIKENKLISLYMYDLENFAKLGKIPDERFVLFSDEYGVVLADKIHEKESRAFSFGAKYFYDFEEYFDKKAVKCE